MKTNTFLVALLALLFGCSTNYPRITATKDIKQLVAGETIYLGRVQGSNEVEYIYYFAADGNLYKQQKSVSQDISKDRWDVQDGELCEYHGSQITQLTTIGCYNVHEAGRILQLKNPLPQLGGFRYIVYDVVSNDKYKLEKQYGQYQHPFDAPSSTFVTNKTKASTNIKAEASTYTKANTYANTKVKSKAKAEANAKTTAEANAKTTAAANTYINTRANANANANAKFNTYTKTKAKTKVVSNNAVDKQKQQQQQQQQQEPSIPLLPKAPLDAPPSMVVSQTPKLSQHQRRQPTTQKTSSSRPSNSYMARDSQVKINPYAYCRERARRKDPKDNKKRALDVSFCRKGPIGKPLPRGGYIEKLERMMGVD